MFRRRSAAVLGPAEGGNTHGRDRRSSITSKLSDIFKNGVANLDDALDDFETTTKLTEMNAAIQRRGADRFYRWAQCGGNEAIDDIAGRIRDLLHLHAEQQTVLAVEVANYVERLRMMKDAESEVKQLENQVKALLHKEKRIRKELRRLQNPGFFSRSKPGDSLVIHHQLQEAIQQRMKAERELDDTRAESEVVKMYRFRHGMKGIADSYVSYSERSYNIFRCHREITELVPAIGTEDVRQVKYEGAAISRDRVEHLRRALDPRALQATPSYPHIPPVSQLLGPPLMRRRREPLRMGSAWEPIPCDTPPPPYTSTANQTFTPNH
ncbi:unnamed protein product [Angiostrongylus costaricensis]|uniref:Uncharacterized protein n=1 Tax=Angiostrongylus costaricensis TaxID=334426 RepID=A0A0R3PBD5_ANGCS|nr:unnamed protein product [Angiostrongylus costaricensis]